MEKTRTRVPALLIAALGIGWLALTLGAAFAG